MDLEELRKRLIQSTRKKISDVSDNIKRSQTIKAVPDEPRSGQLFTKPSVSNFRQNITNIRNLAAPLGSTAQATPGIIGDRLKRNITALRTDQGVRDFAASTAGDTIRGDYGLSRKSTHPALNFAREQVGDSAQTVLAGMERASRGAEKAINKYSTPLERVGGVANAISGGGTTLGAGMIPFQTATALSNMNSGDVTQRLAAGFQSAFAPSEDLDKNVQDQNVELDVPYLGKIAFDPAKQLGRMFGFVNRPENKALFSVTEGVLPGIESNLGKWLLTTGVRGSIEDIVLSLDEMPENPTNAELVKFFGAAGVRGAISEIVTRGTFKAAKAGATKISESEIGDTLRRTFNELKSSEDVLKQPEVQGRLRDAQGRYLPNEQRFVRGPDRDPITGRDIREFSAFIGKEPDQRRLGFIQSERLQPGPDPSRMSAEQLDTFKEIANDVRSGNLANRPGDPKTEQVDEVLKTLWSQFKGDAPFPTTYKNAVTELQGIANKGFLGSSLQPQGSTVKNYTLLDQLGQAQKAGDIEAEQAITARIRSDDVKASSTFIPKEEPDVKESKVPDTIVEQTFKTEKFNVDPEAEATIKAAQESLGLKTRGVKSFADMQEVADELGTSPSRLLKDIESGRITSDEIIALGDTISTSSQRVAELAKQLGEDPTNDSIRTALQNEENLMNEAIKKRIRGGTEAGRAVVAFRKIANNTLDRAYWLDKAQRQIGLDKDLDTDAVKAIDDFINTKDRLGLAVFVSRLGESSGMEKAIALWKAGLLTGLRTHEANMISNTGFGVLETIKDIPATGFDIVRSAITGEPRTKTFGLDQITSQVEGGQRGAEYAMDYIKEGVDPRDIMKAELYEPIRFGDSKMGNIAQKYTDAVFGTLGAEDKIFREAAISRSLAEQTALKGINEGLSVKEMDDLFKNPTPEMLDEAMQDGLYATFNKSNKLADAVGGFKEKGGPITRAGTELLAPFVRTPSNVAEAIFDYTPAGFVKDIVSKIAGGAVSDKRLAESFGRAATGTALIWIGAELSKLGLLTGGYPESRSEAAQRNLEGKQSNALFLGGKWRSLSRVSPIGNLILLGAEFQESSGDFIQTGFAGIKAVTDQPFLKGASQGLRAITDPERYGEGVFENIVSGSVPSFFNDIGRSTDKFIRDTEGVGQKVMARIPGVRETLPAKLNQLGEPIEQQPGGIMAFFDPFNSRVPNEDALVQEFDRVDYNLNYVGDRLNNEKLTQAQRLEYQRVAGQKIKELLPGVINSTAYQNADIDTQRSIIEKAVNKAKDIAREDIKSRLDEIESQGIGVEASDNVKIPLKQDELKIPTSESGMKSPFASATFLNADGDLKTISIQKILEMPDDTAFSKAKKEKEAYATARKIISEPELDPEVSQGMLDELGITREDAEYFDLANETNDLKSIYVKEVVTAIPNREQMIDALVEMRKEIQGKMVLTSGVIDDLVDVGVISKEEGKVLKDVEYDENGVPKVKKSGRGGGSKLKNVKFVPVDYSGKGVSLPSIRNIQAPRIPDQIPVAFSQPPRVQVQAPALPQFQVKFDL